MSLCILVLCLCCLMVSSVGTAAPPEEENTVWRGSDGAVIRVTARAEGVARIWHSGDGRFERPVSVAVIEPAGDLQTVSVGQRDTETVVRAGGLDVLLRPGGIEVRSAAGRTVVHDLRIMHDLAAGRWSFTHRLAEGDAIYGLGQDNQNNGRLNRRGTFHDLWAGQKINSGNVTAEYSVPFYIVSGQDGAAAGIFIDNTWQLNFDLGKTSEDLVRCNAAGGPADLYIIDGPSIATIIERYTAFTGRPVLPPLWAMGFWQSKCVFWDWRELEAVAGEMEQRQIPMDVLVIDYHWPKTLNDYKWNDQWYAGGRSPEERIRYFARKGIRIVMSNSGPMLRPDASTYASAQASGILATDGKGNPVQCGHFGGHLLDFTSPNMAAWLLPQLQPLVEAGVAGWWLDLTEPEGEPAQTVYHDGRSADTHNVYSLLVSKLYEQSLMEGAPGKRPFLLTRCGPAGIQRYSSAVWTGDVYSDYPTYRAHPPEMLNSGLSGLAWWTSDSGGFMTGLYKNDRYGAHARLYERWMQFSAFSPITRAHKVGAPLPYEFGVATEQGARKYIQLRYRLLPYIYSYAYETSQTGMPLVRPLVMENQGDARYADVKDTYYFGRELVVAPVLYENATGRRVVLPPGEWIDWDYGCTYEGGREWIVPAPQSRIPVFIRAGAIIPMAPVMQNTSEKPWDPITFEIYPSGDSSFRMYSDDGETHLHREGHFTITTIRASERAESVSVEIVASNRQFRPAQYIAGLHLKRVPSAIQLDGREPPYTWHEDTGRLEVGIAAGDSLRHVLEVRLSEKPVVRPAPVNLPEETTMENAQGSIAAGPAPRFYPPPRLPNRVLAANYDLGGEGVGYLLTRPATAKGASRVDDAGLVPCDDVGGGECVSELRKDEWLNYSIDAGDGGYFDLIARVASEGNGGRFRLLLSGNDPIATVAVTTEEKWHDVVVPNVYLNGGENALMLYVEDAGFRVHYLEFRRAANPPATVRLERARLTGDVRVRPAQAGVSGCVEGIGRKGTSLTASVHVPVDGEVEVALRYANGHQRPVTLMISLGESTVTPIVLPPTGGWEERGSASIRLRDRAAVRPLTISATDAGGEPIHMESAAVRAAK